MCNLGLTGQFLASEARGQFMSILSIQRPQGGCEKRLSESLRAVMHVPGDFNLEIKFVNGE